MGSTNIDCGLWSDLGATLGPRTTFAVLVPDVVRQLCAEVLAGRLSLDAFEARRPSAGSDPFLQQVLEDLEDGIEHTPSRWLGGGVDRRAWERSPEFLAVYLDCCLLGARTAAHSADDLLQWRATIDASCTRRPTRAIVERSVELCLGGEVWVSLLDEAVDVWRPVRAQHVRGNVYALADQPYDRELETWQFDPGDEVVCELIDASESRILVAVALAWRFLTIVPPVVLADGDGSLGLFDSADEAIANLDLDDVLEPEGFAYDGEGRLLSVRPTTRPGYVGQIEAEEATPGHQEQLRAALLRALRLEGASTVADDLPLPLLLEEAQRRKRGYRLP